MRKNMLGLLVVLMGFALVGCTTPPPALFEDEFDSLDSNIWSSLPSLTPFPDFEGSNTPGEIKVENGVLKLSRYAPEFAGANPVSYIQSKNTVYLPDTYSAAMRFKNEFAAFQLGKLFVAIYKDKIWVGQNGIDGLQQDSFEYRSSNDNYFILSLHVTSSGYTVTIKEDMANSTEETFSKYLDLSQIAGDSTITILGGSNTESAQYSEIDYIRISN